MNHINSMFKKESVVKVKGGCMKTEKFIKTIYILVGLSRSLKKKKKKVQSQISHRKTQ